MGGYQHIPQNIPNGFNTNYKGFIQKYSSSNNDMILSENLKMSLDSIRTRRNNNTIISGMAGTGKSRYFIKPNLLQTNSSYMVMDPVGRYQHEMRGFFAFHDYAIKTLDLQTIKNSNHYNPLDYLDNSDDLQEMVDCIFANIEIENCFERDVMKSLLLLAIAYTKEMCNISMQNLYTVIDILNNKQLLSEITTQYESKQFKNINYKCVHINNINTISTLGAQLTAKMHFIKETESIGLLKNDEMGLYEFGQRKTICFVILPIINNNNFLAPLLCMQLQSQATKLAFTYKNNKTPVHIMCMLDEFPNVGIIPNIDTKLSTCRPINMSYILCIHTIRQIQQLYPNSWKIIAANCDIHIHLSAMDEGTLMYIYNDIFEFMPLERLRNRPYGECFVCVRGEYPIMDYLYTIEKHKNYKYIK